MKKEMKSNFIKFLGTAGARFVVTTQMRASGGIWISLNDVNILIDPGPGSLVRIINSKPKLDPKKLDAIFVSHKHIDHSNDTSIIIEAMTQGGKQKKGLLLLPEDMLNEGGGIYPHALGYLAEPPIILKEEGVYKIKNVIIKTPIRHIHSVETYGCIIENDKISIGYIADTAYFPLIEQKYQCQIIIMNVVLIEEISGVDHLSIKEAKKIIENINANVYILTHFGMRMLHSKPWEIAKNLSEELNKNIIAANDGFMLSLQ